MDLKNESDEQLVCLFKNGDKFAAEEILVRYKNTVLAVARRFFLAGGDTEDLVQEGMCGLYSAIITFDGRGGFGPYARACIKNRIVDAVKKSCSNKNAALNGSAVFTDGEEGFATPSFTPEEQLIGSETASEFSHLMKDLLSPLEYRAISMYVEGATMAEISSALGKTYKQTDNALVRAKNKLRAAFNK